MTLSNQQATTLELHRKLDDLLVPGLTKNFISGFDTTHPFINTYLNEILKHNDVNQSLGKYNFVQDEKNLVEVIQQFHKQADGVEYSPDEILISAGSSPLLLVIKYLLRDQSIKSLHYFRPIYHSLYFLAELLGINLQPVCDQPLWDYAVVPSLPKGQQALLFADPIWIAGHAVADSVIDEIYAWQNRTSSLVIVDGTFQYLKWQATAKSEGSAKLSRDHTIRLICPTKSLALHGIRFAYLLGPSRLLKGLRWICDNITGSASAFDLQASIGIMNILSAPNSNRDLASYIQDQYSKLLKKGFVVTTKGNPNCSYYIFAKVNSYSTNNMFMGANYFELIDCDEYVRVNLLSPSLDMFDYL